MEGGEVGVAEKFLEVGRGLGYGVGVQGFFYGEGLGEFCLFG